jgi:predicted enzyme related to lactoylglutathione lyase
MSRVVHFDMAAREPQRLIDFYSAVLDWEFDKSDTPDRDYWTIATGPGQSTGIDGGLSVGEPVGAVMHTIHIADLAATLSRVEQHGGRVVQPRSPLLGVGWHATFEDPEGNRFGLLEAASAEASCGAQVTDEPEFDAGEPEVRTPRRAGRSTGSSASRKTLRPARKQPARTAGTTTRPRRSRSR